MWSFVFIPEMYKQREISIAFKCFNENDDIMRLFNCFQTVWACNLCRKKQELLAKTGAWYHGGMARPVALDVGDVPGGGGAVTGSRPGSRLDVSPPNEKKAKMGSVGDGGSASEKENFDRQKSFGRASSLQGRELKRQFSMSDAVNSRSGHDGTTPVASGQSGGEMSSAVEGGQTSERGRVRERTTAKHRYHSESRLSETDKRFGTMQQPDPARQRGEREQGERSERDRSERDRDRHSVARSRDPSAERGSKSTQLEERKLEGKEGRERHR